MTWPWQDIPPNLPVTRYLAMGRFRSTAARMRSKPDLMKHYDIIIQDQLDKEIVEKVYTIFNLPVTRYLAMGRLRSTAARMRSKPDLMKHYDVIIQDQLDKEIVEKVNSIFNGGTTHYIYHHAVIKLLKLTTKVRIVYDASARKRKDMNVCLYRGPVILNDLCR